MSTKFSTVHSRLALVQSRVSSVLRDDTGSWLITGTKVGGLSLSAPPSSLTERGKNGH
jgi:hypothetical protein